MINPSKSLPQCFVVILLAFGLSFGNSAQASVSINLESNRWALISIPASNPGGDSPSIIFGSQLPIGSYGAGGSWVLYDFNTQSNAYTVVPIDEILTAGKGYWAIQITGANVNVDLSLHSRPFDVKADNACPGNSGCVEVPLPVAPSGQRWSLHGYPQKNQQLLGSTRVRTSDAGCSGGCTFDEASQTNTLRNYFYRFDGNSYQRITLTDNLKPAEGFWVYSRAGSSTSSADWLVPTTQRTKVAFTADQETEQGAIDVLKLVAAEEADLLLLQGDLGYYPDKAVVWEDNLDQHLGVNFPVLTVVGNHENFEWPIYKSLITERVNRAPDLRCSGNVGEKATCDFRGIQITQVAVGVKEVMGVNAQDNYPQYIQDTLASSSSPWRICSWHKNQQLMQTGSKSNDPGWDVYQACLNAGAIVATGHEHAYSRTHLMENFETQTIKHTRSDMALRPGQSFAFVSGLGGSSVRPQVLDGDWWASIYTSTQNATHGALFCTFIGLSADCYFKAINGAVPDRFTLQSEVLPTDQ